MDLSIAAIFRNEAPYLKEWIEFHRLVGFESFHLFDNLSTDLPEKVLAPYIAEGIVRLTSWPIDYTDVYEWTEVQCLAYERALYTASGKTKWLALLDVDEFLFSVDGPLIEVLSPFENQGGVAVNWQVFGTSNVAKIGKGQRMIEELTLKAPFDHVTNHYIKSIVRPECVKECTNAHSMTYHAGFGQVNTKGARFEGCLSPTVEISPLRINHYTLRDEHFLKTEKKPRLQKWWTENEKEWSLKAREMNQVEDRVIHRFLPLLKKI